MLTNQRERHFSFGPGGNAQRDKTSGPSASRGVICPAGHTTNSPSQTDINVHINTSYPHTHTHTQLQVSEQRFGSKMPPSCMYVCVCRCTRVCACVCVCACVRKDAAQVSYVVAWSMHSIHVLYVRYVCVCVVVDRAAVHYSINDMSCTRIYTLCLTLFSVSDRIFLIFKVC